MDEKEWKIAEDTCLILSKEGYKWKFYIKQGLDGVSLGLHETISLQRSIQEALTMIAVHAEGAKK